MRVGVRIIIFDLLLAGSLGTSCAQNPVVQGNEQPVREVRDLLTGLDSLRSNGVYREEILKRVENRDQFAAAWAELTSRFRPGPALPVVDFGREWVLIYSPGQQRTGGHRLQLKPAADRRGWQIEHLLPGEGCIAMSQLTSPVLVMAVPLVVQYSQMRVVARKVDCQ